VIHYIYAHKLTVHLVIYRGQESDTAEVNAEVNLEGGSALESDHSLASFMKADLVI